MRLITTMLALLLASSGAFAQWRDAGIRLGAFTLHDGGGARWSFVLLDDTQKRGNSRAVYTSYAAKDGSPPSINVVHEMECQNRNMREIDNRTWQGGNAWDIKRTDRNPGPWEAIPPLYEKVFEIVCAR